MEKAGRILFLDRDGVINRKMPKGDYVKSWSEFRFLPGVFEAFKLAAEKGLSSVIVTNQRGVARGILSRDALEKIHRNMIREIRSRGGDVEAVYYCPHEIGVCDCRKPRPGMILRAIEELRAKDVEVDLSRSFMVGDSESDVLAGRAAGLGTVIIGQSVDFADGRADSLLDAVRMIAAFEV